MLSIILSACLIADPGQCRDFKIQTDFQMPAKYCTMAAQPVVAQWPGSIRSGRSRAGAASRHIERHVRRACAMKTSNRVTLHAATRLHGAFEKGDCEVGRTRRRHSELREGGCSNICHGCFASQKLILGELASVTCHGRNVRCVLHPRVLPQVGGWRCRLWPAPPRPSSSTPRPCRRRMPNLLAPATASTAFATASARWRRPIRS